MTKQVRAILVPLWLASTLLLLLFSCGALASRAIAVAPGGSVSMSGVVTFSSPELEGTVVAEVTLTGELEVRVNKDGSGNSGSKITRCAVTGIRVVGISGVTAVVRCELTREVPLHYNAFLGTLPNITGVLVVAGEEDGRGGGSAPSFLLALRSSILGRVNECLYRGPVGLLTSENGGGQSFDQVRILPEASNELLLATSLEARIRACARRGRLEGTLRLATSQRVSLEN